MALSASTVFEINSGATSTNVNGGGFNPANANMLADLTTDSNTANTNSPVCSSASYNFVAGDVGHWLYIKSGTNWTPGWYQIASVASNKATLSAAVGQAIQVVNNRYGTNTVAGCATTGTPTGGTWSIDYSQSTASPFAATDLASSNGSSNPSSITSAGVPFSPQMTGNLIHVTAGTNWTVGWYEIVSVSGSTATLDRAVGTAGALTNGTGKTGGALSLGSSTAGSTDDNVFELAVSSSTAAARFFIKGNATYTMTTNISISASGNARWPVIVEGYASTRGDRPTGSTRPLLAFGSNSCTWGARTDFYSLSFTTRDVNGIILGATSRMIYCKSVNTSQNDTTRMAFTGSSGSTFYRCEAVAYKGSGIYLSGGTASATIDGCYLHDCGDNGLYIGAGGGVTALNVMNCLFASNVVIGARLDGGITGPCLIANNTFYGAENKLGVGMSVGTTSSFNFVKNNIFYGCVTGISGDTTDTANFGDYNDFYNNTNDVNNVARWQKGANDKAQDPQFTNVSQVVVTTATTSDTGNTLVKSGATFQASGVTAGRDFVYISTSPGGTTGIYGIASVDSETQLTLSAAPGNSSNNVSAQITVGRNFYIGRNLAGEAYPGTFPAALTAGYMDIGAVQRREMGETAYTFVG